MGVMNMATSQPESPARKLRWFQYSLRSLLLLVLLVSLGMSWVAVRMKRTRQQDEAVEEITKFGGWALYDYQNGQFGDVRPTAEPPGPAWLRNLLGENFFATVVEVHFASPLLTDRGLEHLKGLSQLRWLDLPGTQVTDSGLEHLKGLKQLQILSLNDTKVTDAGLQHLKGLPQLEWLDLDGTQVTDAGLEHLKGLTHLWRLTLHRTNVTDQGENRLQRALPECEILR
jgi:hypothetical protein